MAPPLNITGTYLDINPNNEKAEKVWETVLENINPIKKKGELPDPGGFELPTKHIPKKGFYQSI